MEYLDNINQMNYTPGEVYNSCNDIYNLIEDYYNKLHQIIHVKTLTKELIEEHDKTLNLLLGSCIALIGQFKITAEGLHTIADNYLTKIGLNDSNYYMDREDLLERYKRISIKELIDFGLIPNPNYSKTFGTRVIYYSDNYYNWIKAEILDVVTNITKLRKTLINTETENIEYAFGLLVTLNILLETTNTTVDIPWSDI